MLKDIIKQSTVEFVIPPQIVAQLNRKATQYNHVDFIANDPISIPHKFNKKQDIEIAALFAAALAWGNRKTIINSCNRLLDLMDNAPFEFVSNTDLNSSKTKKHLLHFVHRTFNSIDLIIFLKFLQYHYKTKKQTSLETAFCKWVQPKDETVEQALNGFYHYFFNTEIHGTNIIERRKHVAAPFKNSACKRLNMFLRWMVRSDKHGVDFGFWKTIQPNQLVMPLDVHVMNVAQRLQLLPAKAKPNWNTALTLTNLLKILNPKDPVLYDYALFGMGIGEKE